MKAGIPEQDWSWSSGIEIQIQEPAFGICWIEKDGFFMNSSALKKDPENSPQSSQLGRGCLVDHSDYS
jgi:hypothetical protein